MVFNMYGGSWFLRQGQLIANDSRLVRHAWQNRDRMHGMAENRAICRIGRLLLDAALRPTKGPNPR